MTIRERTALTLVALGLIMVGVCAWAYGGWEATVGVVGAMLVLIGVLLGLDNEPQPTPPPAGPELIDDETEDGVQRG